MRRVLFDENLPRKLRRDLPDCVVRTVQEEGWGTLQNGDLLHRAEEAFEVFVTADRRMQYQHNLANYSIGVVVLVTPRLRLQTLRKAIDPLRAAISRVNPGEIVHIKIET